MNVHISILPCNCAETLNSLYVPQPKTVKVISPPFCDIFAPEKKSQDLSFPLQRVYFLSEPHYKFLNKTISHRPGLTYCVRPPAMTDPHHPSDWSLPFEPRPYGVSSTSPSSTSPSANKDTKNMDPFEVRIRFTQHLQHLNASVTSANKAAQYAIKYRDMDEDLHSCILEQLERVCTLFFPRVPSDHLISFILIGF